MRNISSLFLCSALSFSAEVFAEGKMFLGLPIDGIDIHMHPGTYEGMGPKGREFVKKSLPPFIPEEQKEVVLKGMAASMLDPYGAAGIKLECEKAGLSLCGLFAVYAPDTWGVSSNEYVIRKLDDPRNRNHYGGAAFFGLASVRMQNWDLRQSFELDFLREALGHPLMRGIKLAFIHNGIPLNDRRYDSIYGVAEEKDVPVYHHVGSSPLQKLADFSEDGEKETYVSSYDPNLLEEAIVKFPKVKFILGHMGFDFNQEGFDFSPSIYRLAKKYPNVYLEISAFGRASYDPSGSFMDTFLRKIKQENLIDRTIYGSDGPGSPGGTERYFAATLASMERVGFSYAEAEAILKANSIRLFKLN